LQRLWKYHGAMKAEVRRVWARTEWKARRHEKTQMGSLKKQQAAQGECPVKPSGCVGLVLHSTCDDALVNPRGTKFGWW